MCNAMVAASSPGDQIDFSCSNYHLPFACREDLLPSLLSKVGMEFKTIDEAWMFWISYGGQKGFEVRKRYANKRKDGTVRSCRYVCANEGHRSEDKRGHLTKCPRA